MGETNTIPLPGQPVTDLLTLISQSARRGHGILLARSGSDIGRAGDFEASVQRHMWQKQVLGNLIGISHGGLRARARLVPLRLCKSWVTRDRWPAKGSMRQAFLVDAVALKSPAEPRNAPDKGGRHLAPKAAPKARSLTNIGVARGNLFEEAELGGGEPP